METSYGSLHSKSIKLMGEKKIVLIYFPGDASYSPRVLAQILALHDDYAIILAARKFENENYHHLISFLKLPTVKMPKSKLVFELKGLLSGDFRTHKNELAYWNWFTKKAYNTILRTKFDLIISHNTNALSICQKAAEKNGVPHIFNAHEYYPRQFEVDPSWVKNKQPTELFVCNKYLQKVNHIFCVGEYIAKEYQTNFKTAPITFIPNDKPFVNTPPSEINTPIRLIYHGGCKRARNIEKNIEVMRLLDPSRYQLDIMLMVYDEAYYEELIAMAADMPHVNFIPKVPIDDIIPFCNAYDIGLFHILPVTYNLEYCLPNKFFEYVQSRLCIITSPNIEMKTRIEKYELGACPSTYDVKDMANLLNGLSKEQIQFHKNQSHKFAKEFSSEKTYEKILNVVNDLLH